MSILKEYVSSIVAIAAIATVAWVMNKLID
jgi:hypothetical protein